MTVLSSDKVKNSRLYAIFIIFTCCCSIYDETWQHSEICPPKEFIFSRLNTSIANDYERFKSNIDPSYNGKCGWLKCPKLTTNTGVGHALSSLNYNLKVAMKLGLGLYTGFGPSGHLQSPKELGEYFGLSCLFQNMRSPPKNAMKKRVTLSDVNTAVQEYNDNNKLSCDYGHTVFDLGLGTGGMRTDCDYHDTIQLLQPVFYTTYNQTKIRTKRHEFKTRREIYLPSDVAKAKSQQHIVISIHIRRGDIFMNKKARDTRYVPFNVQERMLRLVLQSLSTTSTSTFTFTSTSKYSTTSMYTTPVSIFLLTEGSPSIDSEDTIIEYNYTTNKMISLNIRHQLSDICQKNQQCYLHIYHDEVSALSSFTTMCESDILMPTRSGFSHLAATLCQQPKVVLAIPFWCNYTVGNHVIYSTDTDDVILRRFRHLWKSK